MSEKEKLLMLWMNSYGDEIMRLCYTYVHSWQTAEDLTQETFIKLYRHLEKFRGEAHIKTYIYAIAINVCKDYISSWKHKKIQIYHTIEHLLKTNDSTSEKVIQISEAGELVNKIEKLASKYKDVILLYYYADMTISEISEALKLPENTVKIRLKRGREKLKLMLEEGAMDHAEFER